MTENTGKFTFLHQTESSEISNKKLCLNMIVKNESKIIVRLLESVLKIIDCYCICDTGSDDNTVDLIVNFFKEHNIHGNIISKPFENFSVNRSHALDACKLLDVKHVLLLDADMKLEFNDNFNIHTFYSNLDKCDAVYMFQGSPNFFYKNIRIIRNKLVNTKYVGVTHEYLDIPHENNPKYGVINRNDIFINDIGDGGSKSDKFLRDIRLLTKGLEDEPNNHRYMFYLANSYMDSGQYEKAIEYYKKRIDAKGWEDEVWASHYKIGKCYKNMEKMADAIYWWLEAYNYLPLRLENMYQIINYYRYTGKNKIAYEMIMMINDKKIKPIEDGLFLEKDVYSYKIDYELSIVGYYYNPRNINLMKLSNELMNKPHIDHNILRNVYQNYKFYTHVMKNNNISTDPVNNNINKIIQEISKSEYTQPDFTSSSPSIITHDDQIICNIRFVNYRIRPDGSYDISKSSTIGTKNIITIIKNDKHTDFELEYNKEHNTRYVGIEDIRLFSNKKDNRIYYTGNRAFSNDDINNFYVKKVVIEYGYLDLENKKIVSNFVNIKDQARVEKNWVIFTDKNDKLHMIYKWHPLTIGQINNPDPVNFSQEMELKLTHNVKTPPIFRDFRGSSNGLLIDNEIWFLVHLVSHESRRYYYHILVVLDSVTFVPVRYTDLFSFEKVNIEYSLGFIYQKESNNFIIGYSTMDRTTNFVCVSRQYVESIMNSN